MTIEQRLRAEYGGAKAAMLYCLDLNMNIAQAAKQLGVSHHKISSMRDRYGMTFPNGYKTRDMTATIEAARERVTRANLAGTMGKQVNL